MRIIPRKQNDTAKRQITKAGSQSLCGRTPPANALYGLFKVFRK